MFSSNKIKKQQIIIASITICSFIGVVILGLWVTDPERGKPSMKEVRKSQKEEVLKNFKISSKDALSVEGNWINKSEDRFKSIEDENKKLKKELLKMQLEIKSKKLKIKKDEVVHKQSARLKNLSIPLPPPRARDKKIILGESKLHHVRPKRPESVKIVEISLGTKKNKAEKNIDNYIPAGSFSEVMLLSGLDAPTGGMAKSDPIPVILKVQNHAQLPNRFKSKIKDCHIIGAAHGNMSSERGHIRLEKMSCVLSDKRIIEAEVTGFVTGEDGKSGFRGKVVSKQGAMIAKAALAGVFAGMGNSLSSQYQTVSQSAIGSVATVDPKKIFQSGLAGGASNALNKIADFYIARANETFPIIEIDAGRTGEVVLTKGTRFEYSIGEIRQ